jgi:ParB/RepB/Spo0J family partition protein
MTATKASSRKGGKKKTTKKRTTKKRTTKKRTTKKKSSRKKSSRKKTATKKRSSKRAASAPAARMGVAHTLNGIEVVTPDGRAPGKKGAQGYVEGSRIKLLKSIQDLRSGGIGDIAELTKSVRTKGLIEPLVVRPAGDGKNFELIAGERRLKSVEAVGGPKWQHVPVIVRTDLQENDDDAIAVAIAENSPDGRSNLNIVDIGRQAVKFQGKGWSTDRMAKSMGLHVKKVRRSLEITQIPPDLQERVASGEVSVNAAIEVKKCPPKLQKKIAAEIGPGMSAPDIRRIRKRLEREEEAKKVEQGEDIAKRRKKTGEESTAPKLGSWQKPTEKSLQVGQMCHAFANAEDEEVGTTQWHELRGAIGYALWDRGDLGRQDPLLPSVHEDEMADSVADKKFNALFDTLVQNEAARHEKRGKS